jgi:hypothetical protein
MREKYPGHYAMTFLGFALGKRPSTTRPLRRKGESPDVHWDTGVLLFRRSNTIGQRTMEGVKTGGEERVQVPEDLLALLRWHVETQLRTGPAGVRSALPRAARGLPNAQRARQAVPVGRQGDGVKEAPDPRGMRRTFQDLCRAAQVSDLVTRSISGHATESMQRHYSTVALDEQRRGLSNVIQLLSPTASSPAVGREVGRIGEEDRAAI